MEKAYDIKELGDKLKDEGLDVLEDVSVVILKSVMSWIKESAELSEGKFDDMLVGVLPMIEGYVLEQIDKIDGEEDD